MHTETAASGEIAFEVGHGFAHITLNRPQALNALTLAQVEALDAKLVAWGKDSSIHAAVIDGVGEKAFCSGGDLRGMFEAIKRQDNAYMADYYRKEYSLNRRIKSWSKPYVAFLNGIVMGGGAGVSIHGSHRVTSERTVFAMPETGIGFFPDVGGTYFLSRCPGSVGVYLALTGTQIKAADMQYCNLATHNVPEDRMAEVVQALREADTANDTASAITWVLDAFHEDPGMPTLDGLQDKIDRVFSFPTLEEIFGALKVERGEWAETTLRILRARSPLALKVALRQMQIGGRLDFDRTMQVEYRVAMRMVAMPDFREGIRAVIIDKDKSPKWEHVGAADVPQKLVDSFFAPLDCGDLAFADS